MTAAALGAYIVFEDEAGFSMTPPRARTWGRRGHTPVVRVRGRSWRRWSIAAMCCYKPGETSRLIYRPRRHRKHRGKGRDTFAWSDYRDLIVRAHIQLQAPIVLIWDNLNTHRTAGMREYAACTRLAHDRPTALLRTGLEPGRGHLVPVTARAARKRCLHRRRAPRTHPPPGLTSYPAPTRPHRWLPGRHQTDPHPPADNNLRKSVI